MGGGVRVWLNPPYSRPLIERFVEKMVRNNNGIALLFNRCDSKMFQDLIFPKMQVQIMFVKGRIKNSIDQMVRKEIAQGAVAFL